MKRLKKYFFPFLLLSLFPFISQPLLAANSVTGTVNVSMSLVGSCLINGGQISDGSSFGSLDFGSQSSLFTLASGTIKSSNGSLLTILCNADTGTTPTLTLVSGTNDDKVTGQFNHAMKNGTSFINYSLYSDSDYTTAINPNTAFFKSKNNGTAETVSVYARAAGGSGLAMGQYTDTITLRIDF